MRRWFVGLKMQHFLLHLNRLFWWPNFYFIYYIKQNLKNVLYWIKKMYWFLFCPKIVHKLKILSQLKTLTLKITNNHRFLKLIKFWVGSIMVQTTDLWAGHEGGQKWTILLLFFLCGFWHFNHGDHEFQYLTSQWLPFGRYKPAKVRKTDLKPFNWKCKNENHVKLWIPHIQITL